MVWEEKGFFWVEPYSFNVDEASTTWLKTVFDTSSCPSIAFLDHKTAMQERQRICLDLQVKLNATHRPRLKLPDGITISVERMYGSVETVSFHKCVVCRKKPSLKCINCQLMPYCSSLCQKTDWKVHRRFCREGSVDAAGEESEHGGKGKDKTAASTGMVELEEKVGCELLYYSLLAYRGYMTRIYLYLRLYR